jgi:CHASE2 domain-containing sensor protein
MRDDDWSRRRIKADRCKFADPPASSNHHAGSTAASVVLYREKNGPAVANCASLPSNLFRAVQGRTLMFTLKAFIALVVTWCLLAVAAVVAASTQRFEGLYMYLVAAAVLVGLVIVAAIAIAP